MTQEQFNTRYTYNFATDQIGSGAFGDVYKAYDELTGRFVAIKIAKTKQINGKKFSIKQEYDAVKELKVHRNIANYEAVYTFVGPHGEYDYAVMQYYKDGNLSELLRSTELTNTQKEEIAKGLLAGVQFLHENNVIHRDIKPSNILISSYQERLTPKITDFGLSKLTTSSEMSAISNSFGGGTFEYSAPEQLAGKQLKMF